MWRSKKFILVLVLAVVVLAGSIGGVALANDGNGHDSPPEARHEALLDRVTEIYQENTGVAIDTQQLQDAFAQAQSEMRDAALQERLQYLVDEGRITQDQADQYRAWQQARPDMEPFRQQLREWQQSSPDVPDGFGFKGHGRFRGMGGMRGFGGPCVPLE